MSSPQTPGSAPPAGQQSPPEGPDPETGLSPPGPGAPPSPQGGKSSARSLLAWAVVWAVFLVGVIVLASLNHTSTAKSGTASSPTSLSYSQFLRDVRHNEVKSVQVTESSGSMTGELHDGKYFTTQGPPAGIPGTDLALMNQHGVARNYVATSSDDLGSLLFWVLPIGLIVVLWVFMSRRSRTQMSGLTGWSKSKAKVQVVDKPTTTFSDIAGYEAVKQEIREAVEFLKEPDRFSEVGARIPKGMLLVGPPGTGKTLFARAIAGEAGVPFLSITGSEFMEMFVGVGAARVRDLFAQARQNKPSIIFVDEIDAIGRKRGTGLGGGHDEREQTLNQLLAEMDGFEADSGVIILAATNRPDVLDPALLRAGRFDRQIVIPLPTQEERRGILNVHCRGRRVASDVDLDKVARGTPGMSGAELENLVNEAALITVRREGHEITDADIEAARDRVLMGLRRTSLALSPEERRIIAYHEAGHAVLADVLPGADPVHKVTILPTGMALGVTQQLPVGEHAIEQLPRLNDALAVRMGGRMAEELVFGVPSTGAHDDLTSATELATRMVKEWGMSDALGEIAWGASGPVFLGEDLLHTREYSDQTAHIIDQAVEHLLAEQAERARGVLQDNRAALDAVAAALEREESLDGETVSRLVREAQVSSATTTRQRLALLPGGPHDSGPAGRQTSPTAALAPGATGAPGPAGDSHEDAAPGTPQTPLTTAYQIRSAADSTRSPIRTPRR